MAALSDLFAEELLEISIENGTLERDLDQTIFVRDVLASSDVQSFLMRRNVPASAKRRFFHAVFSEKVPWHLMVFLYRMVSSNRESMIVPALDRYADCINRHFGKTEAKVVSAKELSERQIDSIRKILEEKSGLKVDIKTEVDPDIVGGFYVVMDGHMFGGVAEIGGSKVNILSTITIMACLKTDMISA